jgi:hypothetical protein
MEFSLPHWNSMEKVLKTDFCSPEIVSVSDAQAILVGIKKFVLTTFYLEATTTWTTGSKVGCRRRGGCI